MTSPHWERVGPGRHATVWNGHTLQAVRKDGAYDPNTRPYFAVVDRVPLEKGAWSLSSAKSQAIDFVERQAGKAKAERLFGSRKNGHAHSPEAEASAYIERAADHMLEHLADHIPDNIFDHIPEPEPEPEPEPIPEPPPEPEPEPDPGTFEPEPLPAAAAATIDLTATITDPDTLRALNAIKETLSLMREYADVRCVVNLPPRLEL